MSDIIDQLIVDLEKAPEWTGAFIIVDALWIDNEPNQSKQLIELFMTKPYSANHRDIWFIQPELLSKCLQSYHATADPAYIELFKHLLSMGFELSYYDREILFHPDYTTEERIVMTLAYFDMKPDAKSDLRMYYFILDCMYRFILTSGMSITKAFDLYIFMTHPEYVFGYVDEFCEDIIDDDGCRIKRYFERLTDYTNDFMLMPLLNDATNEKLASMCESCKQVLDVVDAESPDGLRA